MMRPIAAAIALFLASSVTVHTAAAQDYPNRPIKMLIGLPAGGGADIIARYFADQLKQTLGQSIVVENKPGAGGNIATQAAASADPDGYTLLFSTSNPLTGNFFLYKNLPFTVDDFAPVTTLGQGAFVLAVNGKSDIKSVADLTAYLKEKAGKAAYGSPTSISLASAELYMSQVGVTARLVRYKASTQALNELKAGEIDYFFVDSTTAIGPLKRGDIRALAVTTRQRNSALPDVPTMQETGIADFDMSSWFGIFVPAKTPPSIRDRLENALNEIVRRKATDDYLNSIGIDSWPGSATELMAQVRRQTETYRKLSEAGKLDAAE
ncbi:MAG: Bug family tripartite tricarboxylate transporter substrate binding protein [Xanthobacteraceae bacterium]